MTLEYDPDPWRDVYAVSDYDASERYAPQPPKSMPVRWLKWVVRLEATSLDRDLRNRARYTLNAFGQMPTWPRQASKAERRKVIHPKLLKVLEAWDGASSMLILGPTGTGKTVGLFHAVEHLIGRSIVEKAPWPVPAMHKALALTQAWRAQKLGSDDVDPPCVAEAKGARLLLLDDVGQEPNDPQAVLMGIADARYDAIKYSLVTSGLTLDQFIARYGEAFLRRFGDVGGRDRGKVVSLW